MQSAYMMEPMLPPITEELADLCAELAWRATEFQSDFHPVTAQELAIQVAIMNCYYTNALERSKTLPRDIERAITGELDQDRRFNIVEARGHIKLQLAVDTWHRRNEIEEPAASDFVRILHGMFYEEAPAELLAMTGPSGSFDMIPGRPRHVSPLHDVQVGIHVPPRSDRVDHFMARFEEAYRFSRKCLANRILACAAAHHRLLWLHPFPDGNGRVARIMSHAMALKAGIGAHGLWSIARGLARGVDGRGYMEMIRLADTPRRGALDGRGHLSQAAFVEWCAWFLRVALDQIGFMAKLFDATNIEPRLEKYVGDSGLRPEAARILKEVWRQGAIARGDAAKIAGLKERTARDLLRDLTRDGILTSDGPKKPVRLRIDVETGTRLFPKLYPDG